MHRNNTRKCHRCTKGQWIVIFSDLAFKRPLRVSRRKSLVRHEGNLWFVGVFFLNLNQENVFSVVSCRTNVYIPWRSTTRADVMVCAGHQVQSTLIYLSFTLPILSSPWTQKYLYSAWVWINSYCNEIT